MNYFIYNGVRSCNLGLRISNKNIFSAPKYDLTFQSIPGRDGELISPNGRFPNVNISYTCFVPSKSITDLSDKLTKIKAWLYAEPDRYHTLSDGYDEKFFRSAVFNNKLDITDQCNKIGVFTVNFSCLPYRYSYDGQIKQIFTKSGFTVTNPYPFISKPYIKINGNGSGRLIIQSKDNNSIWTFTNIDVYIECDSELMNFYKDNAPKNDTVEGEGFPLLHPGENTITFDGEITSLEIIPKWRCI